MGQRLRRRRSALWIGLVSAFLACTSVDPNAPPADACSVGVCEIVLEHVTTISDSAEPGLFGNLSSHVVSQDRSGRFITSALRRDMVLVFDSSGGLLAKIGQRGSGPGEFQRIGLALLGPADTIYVVDVGLQRIVVIAPDLEIVSSRPAFYLPTLVHTDGSFIVARQLPVSGTGQDPIHVTNRGGTEILRSFGADTTAARADSPLFIARSVAPAADGTLWAMPVGRYILERWSLDSGERVQRLAIVSDWFHESPQHADLHDRPGTTVESLWEDATGLIWILSRDADAEWRTPSVPRGTEMSATVEHLNERFDWVLEVVDPTNGTVIATKRFPEYLRHQPPAPLVLTQKASDDYVVRFDVWRPMLQPTSRSGTDPN